MNDLKIISLQAELLLIKWEDFKKKYVKLENTGHVQRELMKDIEKRILDLKNLSDESKNNS